MHLKSNPKKQLSRLYVVMLSLIAIFSVFSEIIIFKLSEARKNDAHLINISGRQRTLSQKICKNVLRWELHNGQSGTLKSTLIRELNRDLSTWEHVQSNLINRDPAANLEGKNSEKVQKMLLEAHILLLEIKNLVSKLILAKPGQGGSVREVILQKAVAYLLLADNITLAYTEEAIRYEIYTERVQLISSILVVFSLLFIVLFIFRPSIRMIHNYFTSLEASEKNYQLLYENSQDLICLHQPDTSFIFVSKAAFSLLGYHPDELVGKSFFSQLHEEDRTKMEKALLHTRKNITIKYQFRRKDGKYILLESNFSFIKNSSGITQNIQSSSRDITQQEAIKEAFLESVDKYRGLVENARDFIYEVNAAGYFTFVNPAFTTLTGFSLEEAKKKRYWEVVKESERERVVRFYENSARRKQMTNYLELTVLTKKGQELHVGQNAIFIYENNHLQLVRVIARDMSRVKEAEERLSVALEQQKIINDILDTFNTTVSLAEKVSTALKLIGQYCGMYTARVVADAGVKESAVFNHTWNYKNDTFSGDLGFQFAEYHHHPAFQEIIRERKIFICDDSQKLIPDLQINFRARKIQSALAVPVYINEEIQAYVSLESIHPREWTRKEIKLLEAFAQILPGIFEREKYIKQLNINQLMLKDTQRLASLGSWEIDPIHMNCILSEETYRILDYPMQSSPLSMEHFISFLHLHDQDNFRIRIQSLIQYHTSLEINVRVKHKNQLFRHVTLKAEPLIEHGKLIKIRGSLQDITNLKHAQEKFQKLFEHSSEANVLLRYNKIVNCNRAFIELFGFSRKGELIGLDFVKELSPDYQQDEKPTLQEDVRHTEILHEKGRHRFEWICKKNDGTLFPIEASSTFLNLDNSPTTLMVIRDLTERKLYEEKLRNSENKIKALFNSTNEAYILINKKLEVVACNELAKEYTYQVWQLKLKEKLNLSKFAGYQAYKKFIRNFEYVLLGNSIVFEKKFQPKAKPHQWFEIKYMPVFDENSKIFGVSMITMDITERKNSEEKMMQLTQAMELAQDGFAILDEQLRYSYLNKSQLIQLGFQDNKEIIGKPWESIFDETEKKRAMDEIRMYLNRFGRWKGEIKAISKQGDILQQDLTMTKLPNNSVVCIFRDNTQRKRNESILVKAKEKAEEATLAKSRFLSTMSHEIRTPMNAVIGMSHLLMHSNPRPEQIQWLKTLRFSADNLLALINDILDFSKIESGKLTLEQNDLSLYEIAHSIKNALSFKASEKGIELMLDFDPQIPKVLIGDALRIAQILNNLVSNAVKFTHTGSVQISLRLINLKNKIATVRFQVKDTGIGIPKHKIRSIFEDFTQASSDTTRKYGGTGLGLSITRKLLELMNTRIEVESEVGKGSAFSFVMRFQMSENQGMEIDYNQPLTQPQTDLGGLKILVVEDNEVNQFVAGQFLEPWNAQFEFADNGRIALQKIQEKDFDIVLMDLEMPEMDGYQASQAIRNLAHDYYKQIPIIALTASAFNEVKEKVTQAGMNDYIMKPFNPTQLFETLYKYTRNRTKLPEQLKEAPKSTPAPIADIEVSSLVNFEKLFQMTQGNANFMNKYVEIARNSFQEFNENIKKALINYDMELFRQVRHKFKPTFELMEIQVLKDLLEEIEGYLKEQSKNPKHFKNICQKMDSLCFDIIREMEIKRDLLIKPQEN